MVDRLCMDVVIKDLWWWWNQIEQMAEPQNPQSPFWVSVQSLQKRMKPCSPQPTPQLFLIFHSIRHCSDQQNTMPSNTRPAILHYTRDISLPLRVNSSTNTDRLQRKQRVCQCDTVVDVNIGVDLEGLSLSDTVVVAGCLGSSIRVVFLLSDRVECGIVSHRVQISTAASIISTLHGRQAIHHLLLGEVQVQFMVLDEVALNLCDSCEGPARTTSTLILNISDEEVRGLRVIDVED